MASVVHAGIACGDVVARRPHPAIVLKLEGPALSLTVAFRGASSALSHLHNLETVHRDIEPAHWLRTNSDSYGMELVDLSPANRRTISFARSCPGKTGATCSWTLCAGRHVHGTSRQQGMQVSDDFAGHLAAEPLQKRMGSYLLDNASPAECHLPQSKV